MTKSLGIYQAQYASLMKDQKQILDDMAQILSEAKADGYKVFEVMEPQKVSAEAPAFDL